MPCNSQNNKKTFYESSSYLALVKLKDESKLLLIYLYNSSHHQSDQVDMDHS